MITPTYGTAPAEDYRGTPILMALRDRVHVSPREHDSDDGKELSGVLASEAQTLHRPVVLLPGTYTFATTVSVPSGTRLIIPAGVTINSTIAAGDGSHNVVFLSDPLNGASATTTLSAQATVGDKTITVTSAASIAVGDYIMLTSTDFDHSFLVANKASNTLTLDIPVWKTFANGSSVYKYTPGRDILIEGEGSIVSTGASDGILNFRGAWDCKVKGLRVSAGNTQSVMRFGRGGRRNIFEDISAVGDGTNLTYGFFLTSEWGSKVINCRARWTQAAGVATKSCGDCVVNGAEIQQSSLATSDGLLISGNDTAGDTTGCIACHYENIAIRGARSGIRFYDGSAANTFEGIDIRDADTGAANYGVVITNIGVSGAAPVNNLFSNLSIVRCATGFMTNDNCAGIRVTGLYTEDCSLFDLRSSGAGSEMTIDGWRFYASNKANLNAPLTIDGTGAIRLNNVYGTISTTNNVPFALLGTGGLLAIADGEISRVGNNATNAVFHVYNNAAVTLRVRDWKSGANFGGGFAVLGTTATLRLGGRIEYQGTITGGQVNRGTIALNGATPVTYNFTDIQAGELAKVTRQANGGTPANFIATTSAGVGVVLTGTAGDTSTIAVEIVS